MLYRVLSGLLRRTAMNLTRGRTGGPDRGARARSFEAHAQALESHIRRLCDTGQLELALLETVSRLPLPENAEEAQWLVRHVLMPQLEACVARGDASVACRLEQDTYPFLVTRIEDPAHFEACLSLIDGPMNRVGLARARPVAPLGDRPAERLLFFVHNLGNDFAHTLLLRDLLVAYVAGDPRRAASIGIAGVGGDKLSPAIDELKQRHGITVHVLRTRSGLDGPIDVACGLLAEGHYDRLIVVSVPVAVSYMTGLLPPCRLGWMTMKYQLACFDKLQLRYSFRSGVRREQSVAGRRWLQAPPLFTGTVDLKPPTGTLPKAVRDARGRAVVLYTINREEKIRNPVFLRRVARILKATEDAVFVWTGRERLAEIDRFFAAEGLAQRHHFAGWVVPDDLLQAGDLFLDTPVLSGNVAAQAMAAGVPVVTDAQAVTWIGTFLPAYDAERGVAAASELDTMVDALRARGIELQGRDDDHFVAQASALARDPALRRQFAQTLQRFAQRYFFNAASAAEDHFANMRLPLR